MKVVFHDFPWPFMSIFHVFPVPCNGMDIEQVKTVVHIMLTNHILYVMMTFQTKIVNKQMQNCACYLLSQ